MEGDGDCDDAQWRLQLSLSVSLPVEACFLDLCKCGTCIIAKQGAGSSGRALCAASAPPGHQMKAASNMLSKTQ